MRGLQIAIVVFALLGVGSDANSSAVGYFRSPELMYETNYNSLGRGGCFGSPYLPMGSAGLLGAHFNPLVNCFPGMTLDPWMMSGGADGRYYIGYPWVPRNPYFPFAGASPDYYHSRRYRDDERSTSSSSYSYSFHSASASRPPSGNVQAWDFVVNRGRAPTPRVELQEPSALATSPNTGSASGQAGRSGNNSADNSAEPFAPLVIEPVAPRDQSLVVPRGALPQGLHAAPARAAIALNQPAADSARGAVASSTTSNAVLTPRPPAARPAAPPPRAPIVNDEVGGRRPAPPIASNGEMAVPAPVPSPPPPRLSSSVRPPSAATGRAVVTPLVTTELPVGVPLHAPAPEISFEPEIGATQYEDEDPGAWENAGAAAVETSTPVATQEAEPGAEVCLSCRSENTPPAQLNDIEQIVNRLNNSNPAVAGARKLMASLYQSCEALKKNLPNGFTMRGSRQPPDGVESHKQNPNLYFTPRIVAESHFYLATSYDGIVCRDMRKTLPVFHTGGKAGIRYDKDRLTVNPFNNRSNLSGGNLTTMDCSGFVSAAMATAGLKLRKSGDARHAYQMNTADMINMGSRDEDCMKPAQFNKESSIQAGDVFVLRQPGSIDIYGHAMMFENVGEDPFGLANIQSAAQCNDRHINPENFNFSVIHSTSMAGRMAVVRMTAKNLLTEPRSSLKLWVQDLAIKACESRFAPGGVSAVVTYPLKGGLRHRGITVLRHVGSGVSACIEDKPVKVIGEECIEGCEELR